MKRAEKITLLTQIVQGVVTSEQITKLRKSREPIYVTLNLGDDTDLPETNDPTYHIEISDNWNCIRRYNRYADGRIEELD